MAGDAVTLLDGATAIGATKVAAGGAWSITLASPLGVGAHSLLANETDASGNKTSASPVQSITIASAVPNAVVFVGTPGTDHFTGGAGDDIFRFADPNLAETDIVAGGGGSDELLMTSPGTVAAGGVSAVEVYRLANGGANTLILGNSNFAGVIATAITIDGGTAGNTVVASALTGTGRILAVGGAGKDVVHRRGRQRHFRVLGDESRQHRFRQRQGRQQRADADDFRHDLCERGHRGRDL